MRKQGNCLEKETIQGTMPGVRRRGRPRADWIDNIKSWTGLSVEESDRMTEDRDKWRKYVHGVANPRIDDGKGTEQNRTYFIVSVQTLMECSNSKASLNDVFDRSAASAFETTSSTLMQLLSRGKHRAGKTSAQQ